MLRLGVSITGTIPRNIGFDAIVFFTGREDVLAENRKVGQQIAR